MTTTCTNPNCSITLAPGATKCWLCGWHVLDAEETEILGIYNDSMEAIGQPLASAKRIVEGTRGTGYLRAFFRESRRPLVDEVARLQKERDDLRAKLEAAERRQPVDRERAIDAVIAKLEFMSRDEACEAVTAILGAAKAEPEKQAQTEISGRKGVRAAMELAVKKFSTVDCGGIFNLANLSSALMELSGLRGSIDGMLCRTIMADRDDVEPCVPERKGCAHYRIKPPVFVPAPTGEAPSEELVERMARVGFEAWHATRWQGEGNQPKWESVGDQHGAEYAQARAIYALIAADHAAQVKRERELEGMVTTEHDNASSVAHENMRLSAEVERLKSKLEEEKEKLRLFDRVGGERIDERLAKDADQIARLLGELDKARSEVSSLQAEASRPCPADGMSDMELGARLRGLWYSKPGFSDKANELFGADARGLFGKGAK